MGDLKDMQGFDPDDKDNNNLMMDQSIIVGDGPDGQKDDGYVPPQNLLGDIDADEGPNTTRERSGTLALDAGQDFGVVSDEQI